MAQILYYLFIIFLTCFIGFSAILYAKEMKKNWIPRSFILGTSIIILVSFWMSYLSKNGLRPIAWIVIGILLLFSAVSLIRNKLIALKYIKSISTEDFICMILCILSGIIPLTLYIVYGAEFPYVDGFTYICNADYLMDCGYRIPIDINETITHPWLSQTYLYQTHHFRIGAQMMMALISSLLNLKFSIEVFLPLTSYCVLLCGMSAWSMISDKFNVNKYTKIAGVIMMCFNLPIILYIALYGFLPQIMGSALFLAAIAYFINWDEWENDRKWNIVAVSIVISSFALTYNEMLPFFILIILVIVGCKLIVCKHDGKKIFYSVCVSGILSILLIIVYIPGMIKAILSQFGAVVGGHQIKDINTYLAYYLSTVPADYSYQTSSFDMVMFVIQLATLLMFCCIIIGFYKIDPRIKLDFICISIPYIVFLVYFVLFSINPFVGGRGNTWSIFKLIQYYFIPLAPFIGIFISQFFEKSKIIVKIFFTLFLIYNSINGIKLTENLANVMENYVGVEQNSLDEYLKLYDEYRDCKESITLHNVPAKHRQMVSYFLRDVELIADWNSDDYFTIIPDVPKDICGKGIDLVYNTGNNEGIAGLVVDNTGIYFEEGFFSEEHSEERVLRWSQKESKLFINQDKMKNGKAILEFEVFTFGQTENSEKIEIYDNNNVLIKSINIMPNEILKESIEIKQEIQEINFFYSGKQIQPGNGDMRELAFAISNYKLTLNEANSKKNE